MYRYFKQIAGVGKDNYNYYWESEGYSDKRINSIKTLNHSTTPNCYEFKTRGEFNGSCLKQNSVIFNHRKVVNIYVVYEISKSFNISDYLALKKCLFGAVSLTRNADFGKYKYSGYGIGFDRHESFSFNKGIGRIVKIFGGDKSLSI